MARHQFLLGVLRARALPLAGHAAPVPLTIPNGAQYVGVGQDLARGRIRAAATSGGSHQNEVPPPVLQPEQQQPELVSWVIAQGGSVKGVTLANLAGRDGGSGWGLKASDALSPGQKLIELPTACLLTYSQDSADPRLLALIGAVPQELWGAKLALQLLVHRLGGEDSPYAPYITMLPQGFPGIPTFFGREGIEAIDYAPVSFQVKKRCRWLADFSQKVLSQLPGTSADPFGGSPVDMNALGWALAAVSSRAFRVRGPTQPAALLPLIDMCNHSFDPNCEVLPVGGGTGALALFAKRQVAPGEPLLISYGGLTNDFLFMDYGFVVPNNPHDSTQLRFDIGMLQAGAMVANVTDALGAPLELRNAPWKSRLLTQLGLEGPGAILEINITSQAPHLQPKFVAAARVLVASDEGEVLMGGSSKVSSGGIASSAHLERLGDLSRPLSKINECAALRALSGVCAVALSCFVRSLEDDVELLAGRATTASELPANGAAPAQQPPVPALPLSEDARLAVQLLAEKKRILSAAIHLLGKQLTAAQGNELLAEQRSGPNKKGQKPLPANPLKGFGAALAKKK